MLVPITASLHWQSDMCQLAISSCGKARGHVWHASRDWHAVLKKFMTRR